MSYRIWADIPPGFKSRVDDRGRRFIARADLAELIAFVVYRNLAHDEPASRFEGRSKLRSVVLDNGETVLIRSYRHGGVLRHLTGGIFLTWPPRPFRELGITEALRGRGVPTVEVYGAGIERIWGPLYRGWLVTRELEKARDLWSVVQSGFINELGVERVLRAVAESLRSLHREGVFHSDLNLKNILVRSEDGKVRGYIIDFDKARLFSGRLCGVRVQKNLNRLLRSARKLDPDQKYFPQAYWERLVEFYHEDDLLGN